jgi:hypothetical protein
MVWGKPSFTGMSPTATLTRAQASGAPSPNGNLVADAAATAASDELTEAITDPLGTAWWDSSRYEIGDECAYYYGFSGYLSGKADVLWDGTPFCCRRSTATSRKIGGSTTLIIQDASTLALIYDATAESGIAILSK